MCPEAGAAAPEGRSEKRPRHEDGEPGVHAPELVPDLLLPANPLRGSGTGPGHRTSRETPPSRATTTESPPLPVLGEETQAGGVQVTGTDLRKEARTPAPDQTLSGGAGVLVLEL
jgi:hypothetical protein